MRQQNVIIASGPVIIEDGRVLLVKHGDDPFWKFPGGKRYKEDPDFETTAKREAKEEMGIEVELEAPLKPMLARREDGGLVVLIHYLAKRRGEIQPGSHIREWGWFPINDLPPDAGSNIAPVIEDYKKRFANRAR